jgi:coatomer subunit beta'
MLLLLASGDHTGLEKLAADATQKGLNNLAFAALLQLGDPSRCVDLLIQTNRPSEAALFARTYNPKSVVLLYILQSLILMEVTRQLPAAVKAWKADLESQGKEKIAEMVADPVEHPELFA